MILSFNHVHYKTYVAISFPMVFVITLGIFFIFQPPLSTALFSSNLLLLFIISIAIIVLNNLLYYRALDSDYLKEIQTFELLHYIPLIIFTSIIFTDERNFYIIIPALIASCVIIWSHWENHHFKIRKNTLPFLLWSLAISPIRAAIQKVLLFNWNPISLEMTRAGAVATILNPLSLGPKTIKHIKHIQFKAFLLLIATNILTSIAWILYFFSYQRSGVIYTVPVFLTAIDCVFCLRCFPQRAISTQKSARLLYYPHFNRHLAGD